ncbi:MAG: phospho-N-acetylmuramoyl-pentapeptide-transferase [Deltaproteobacteria bacterium]|nr:phospho-N-acetylmuramoyl-pentapeptide-transferase [Deltaproteobacteria bacterium]
MLFHLLFQLRDLGPLRVFRYTSFRVLAATATALLVALVLYPWFIRRLRREQIGESIREDGPQTHQVKAGTPTMGGALILFALVGTTLLWADLTNPYTWLVLVITVCFGALGFIDDYMKLKKIGKKRGLSAMSKLLVQLLVAAAVAGYLVWVEGFDTRLYLPFVPIKFGWLLPALIYFLFVTLVVVVTSNAVNLTDGLDGLAIVPVIISGGVFLVLAYGAGTVLSYTETVGGVEVLRKFDFAAYLRIPSIRGAGELAIFCGAMVGAGIGFLWYNTYPASVFMGDVGSLALGGALGMLAVLTKNELLLPIVGGIFVLEAISVITQTTSYKLTGKRVFRMAPIHHHFELKGWKEPKIIVRFWIVSMMLAIVALASLKLR